MSQEKHTPGPWEVWQLAEDSDPEGRRIITADEGETEVCGIVPHEADAILIAAAPELLEACQAFVTAYEKPHQLEKTDTALRLAKAAIAKANGEQTK